MKANAPEKIYVYIPDDDMVGTASTQKGFPHQFVIEEYVRKDAFIEKAVEFMEKIDDVDEYSWYNEEEHAAGITEECIEDFKKYMEGKL